MSAFGRQLIHTCTIQRNTPVQNSKGEMIPNWAVLVGAVACRYVVKEEKVADETQSAAGLQMRRVDRLLLPAGTDITAADRITNIVIENDDVMPGPYGIEEVITRRGPKGQKHVSVKLEQVG